MHDTGGIPEGAYGWKVSGEPGGGNGAWTSPRFKARGWWPAKPPCAPGRDGPTAPAYAFRHEFTLDRDRLGDGDEFKLEVTARVGSDVQVWLDGKPLDAAEAKKDKRTYPVPDSPRVLGPGRHVVAVRVAPPAGHVGPIFDLRGDVVRRPKGRS